MQMSKTCQRLAMLASLRNSRQGLRCLVKPSMKTSFWKFKLTANIALRRYISLGFLNLSIYLGPSVWLVYIRSKLTRTILFTEMFILVSITSPFFEIVNGLSEVYIVVNPRHACAVRLIVLGLSVRLSVCLSVSLSVSLSVHMLCTDSFVCRLKARYQRLINNIISVFNL